MSIHVPTGPSVCVKIGIPIVLHWSLPALGGLIALLPWLGGTNVSGLQGFLAITLCMVLLVLFHELGHALFALLFRVRVLGLFLSGFGGLCFVANEPSSRIGRGFFYAGGLLAQVVLFVISVISLFIFGAPTALWATCAAFVFIGVNPVHILINLVPYKNNDGERLLHTLRGRVC